MQFLETTGYEGGRARFFFDSLHDLNSPTTMSVVLSSGPLVRLRTFRNNDNTYLKWRGKISQQTPRNQLCQSTSTFLHQHRTSVVMDESIPTETTPFLQQRDTENVDSLEETSDTKAVALPKAQFTVLCLLRTLDPMSFTQIFPYINQFMSDLRVTDNPSRIGFYSGLVVSVNHLPIISSLKYSW